MGEHISKDPLHGVTLEYIIKNLVEYYGWEELGKLIPIRCFDTDPSITSSLRFLRKTPWARTKVEGLYIYTLKKESRDESTDCKDRGL
ncbi:MAG: VF530 family protein [Verrucomicrobia bacterium]|nr:VF530 family protein [Verrucomicrobiota bacterium]MDA1065315.1 VF530 family protein [Verrucomicrobiota bacterium]